MKRWKKRAYSIACGVFGLIQLVQPGGLYGQSDSTLMSKLINRTNISGQWFLAWQYKQSDESNLFLFKRGYFNVATKMSDNFSLRFTQDITLDEEGMDAGNVEMRLKYLYLKAKPANSGFLRNSYFELGLVHRPWLSFVEDVNRYRVQGTMFAERYKVVNSADFGVLFVCLLGNGLNEEYQKNVSKNLPGKYGSFSLGLFNGGGYHAIEYNNNKTIEGRLSLRPLPEQMPGLQGNYAFAFGKGNTTLSPDFEMNLFALTYQSKYLNMMAEYYMGKGDMGGIYADTTGASYSNDGYSAFIEAKIPKTGFALFGRYDNFVSHQAENLQHEKIIGGISYYFLNMNKLLIDVENDGKNNLFEIALQISF